jgi:peptidyl-prolyl cis-trans isomerase C
MKRTKILNMLTFRNYSVKKSLSVPIRNLGVIVGMAIVGSATAVWANPKADYEFIASVNGVAISQGLLELNLKGAIAQGQKDSPELRQTLKEELINRELITQAATKEGLEKNLDLPSQVAQLKQTLMIQAYIENHFQKNPIPDTKLREEYDRQRKLIGEGASASQYRISQIIVANEGDAVDLIRRVQKGELFGKLAQEYSIDPASKVNGGQLGWVLAGQVVPAVSNVMVNLNKGAISNAPIQTQGGWVIVKVDDKRPFMVPSFEESKPQLRQALVQQYLVETVKKLRETARIVQ